MTPFVFQRRTTRLVRPCACRGWLNPKRGVTPRANKRGGNMSPLFTIACMATAIYFYMKTLELEEKCKALDREHRLEEIKNNKGA